MTRASAICSIAAVQFILLQSASQAQSPSTDFVACAAYSRVIAKTMQDQGMMDASVRLLTRSDAFLGFAIELDRLERVPASASIQLVDMMVGSIAGSMKTFSDAQQIIAKYDGLCPGVVIRARELHKFVFPGEPDRK